MGIVIIALSSANSATDVFGEIGWWAALVTYIQWSPLNVITSVRDITDN